MDAGTGKVPFQVGLESDQGGGSVVQTSQQCGQPRASVAGCPSHRAPASVSALGPPVLGILPWS